jgi:hypothetical protein
MGVPVPRQLDGADVLYSAVRPTGRFHTIPYGADPADPGVVSVVAMAVCRYREGDRYYLFKCDQDWAVVFDWDAGSVEEAMELAAGHVGDDPIEWVSVV